MLVFQLEIGPWYPVSLVHDAAAVLGLSRHLSVEYLECCEQMQQVRFNADRSQVQLNPVGGHVSETPSTPPRKFTKRMISDPIPVPRSANSLIFFDPLKTVWCGDSKINFEECLDFLDPHPHQGGR